VVSAGKPERGMARANAGAGCINRFDQVHGAILERLDRVRPGDWALAMHYPTRWDPRFRGASAGNGAAAPRWPEHDQSYGERGTQQRRPDAPYGKIKAGA